MSARLVKQRPEQWAYVKMLHGKHVNALHLVTMFKRQHQLDKMQLLERLCQLTGKVAIHSGQLTKRQRMKYGDNRLQDGRTFYYLFDRDRCPADVGALVDLKQGFVYV